MARRKVFGVKFLFLTLGGGIVLMLLISSLAGLDVAPSITGILLLPGGYLADLAGYGAHDWAGFLLANGGNYLFY
jgi:hypothetical protein